MCAVRIGFFSEAYFYYTCVDCEAYTVDENSRLLVLITLYIIILYGTIFDFADVTESGILCWTIQFTFCVFCPLAIVIQGSSSF